MHSHITHQSIKYMRRHIDVQADWRSCMDLRSGDHAIDISYGSLTYRPSTNTRPPFYSYSQKPHHFSRLKRRARGNRGPILGLNHGSPRGDLIFKRHAKVKHVIKKKRTKICKFIAVRRKHFFCQTDYPSCSYTDKTLPSFPHLYHCRRQNEIKHIITCYMLNCGQPLNRCNASSWASKAKSNGIERAILS